MILLADGTEAFVGQRVTRAADPVDSKFAGCLIEGSIVKIDSDGYLLVLFTESDDEGLSHTDWYVSARDIIPLETSPQIDFSESEFLSMFG